MDEIRRAFALFDDDGTGKITLRNLKRVAKELGESLDDDELYVSNVHLSLLRRGLLELTRRIFTVKQ